MGPDAASSSTCQPCHREGADEQQKRLNQAGLNNGNEDRFTGSRQGSCAGASAVDGANGCTSPHRTTNKHARGATRAEKRTLPVFNESYAGARPRRPGSAEMAITLARRYETVQSSVHRLRTGNTTAVIVAVVIFLTVCTA